MNKTKMINSLKQLPYEIQNLIYNEYLEKQRDYHIKRLNEKSKLYNLVIDEMNENFDEVSELIIINNMYFNFREEFNHYDYLEYCNIFKFKR